MSKNRLLVWLFVFVCTIFFAQGLFAQKKSPVYFDCKCDDAVGSSYATAFRDLLAVSPRFRAVDNLDATEGVYPWSVSVVSVDVSPRNDGDHAAFSVALTAHGVLISHIVQSCYIENVHNCAQQALSMVDRYLDELRKNR